MKRTILNSVFLITLLILASWQAIAASDINTTGLVNAMGGVYVNNAVRISSAGVGTFAAGTTIGAVNTCLADGTNCPGGTGSGWLNNSGSGNVSLVNPSANVSAGILFIDNTNGRIGINTSTPDNVLDIRTAVIEGTEVGPSSLKFGHYNTNDGGAFYLYLDQGEFSYPINMYANPEEGFSVAQGTSTFALGQGSIYLTTDQFGVISSNFNVDGTGSVGIGTTALLAKLTVNSSSGAGSLRIYNTTGTEHFFINGSSGNVGIGTTIPSSALHINGSTDARLILSNADISQPNNGAPGSAFGVLKEYNTDGGLRIEGYGGTNGATGTGLVLYGITGSSDPPDTLPVIDIITARANGASATNLGSTDLAVQIRSYLGTSYFAVLGGGNVGIGTVAPTSKLDVSSNGTTTGVRITRNSNTTSVTGDSPMLELINTNASLNQSWGTNNNVRIVFTARNITGSDKQMADITAIFKNHTNETTSYNGMLAFSTIGSGTLTERVRIDENGNVGIGTTTPRYIFDVNGSGAAVSIMSTDNTGARLFFNNTGATSGTNGTWDITTRTSDGRIGFRRNASNSLEYFSITDDGKIGIGTATPAQPLDINGTTIHGVFAIVQNQNASGTYKYVSIAQMGNTGFGLSNWANAAVIEGTANGGLVLSSFTGNMVFQTNGRTDRMSILNSSGNVGINTTTPESGLHVKMSNANIAGQSTLIMAENVNGEADITLNPSGGGSNWTFSANDDTSLLRIFQNDTARLAIDGSGNVGIGTIAPIAKLEVAGTINSTGNIYENNVRVATSRTVFCNVANCTVNNLVSGQKLKVWAKGTLYDLNGDGTTYTATLKQNSTSVDQVQDWGVDRGSLGSKIPFAMMYYNDSVSQVSMNYSISIDNGAQLRDVMMMIEVTST
jgi:hypothetical protein